MEAFVAQAQVNVTTYRNNNARDGQNLNETILTPANVNANQFGRLFVLPVDGYVYAQPLYVSNLQIAGGTHNVVFAATEHDSVYAFDSDSNTETNANPLWHVSFIQPAAGVTTVDSTNDLSCTGISPEVGITGTPVIDLTSNTLYVVAKTKENGVFVQRLHALDITTGAEKFGGPVVVQAVVQGTGAGSSGGQIAFDPLRENQRPGLVLLNGVVYVSFASNCDNTPFHGWVMAYNAQSLQQAAVWNSTQNGSDGGIWQSGAAPAADSSGNVYLATGNGTFDLNTGGSDAGDSIVKLGPPAGSALPIFDYFTPYNQGVLSSTDTDLGSGGVVLLPDQPSGSAHQHLLVQMSKAGTLYLVDRDAMGHFNATDDTQIVQSLPIAGGMWATPAFWNNTLYIGGTNDALQAFSFSANNSGKVSKTPVSSSLETYYYPGTTPSISANGNSAGIVWALEEAYSAARLHAYDATNLANELFNTANDAQQALGLRVVFAVPTIANGKVYAGAGGQLAVYGLLGPPPSAPELVSPAGAATGVGLQPALTWSAANGATSYDVYFGTSSPPPMVTNTASTSYGPSALRSSTVYYWMIAARNAGGTASSATWSFTTGNFPAQIASPAPGSTLSGTLATFAWTAVSGATQYQLTVGTTQGGSNVFNGTTIKTSQTVTYIPCAGGTVYVQLAAEVNGSFLPATAYTYSCRSGMGDFNADGYHDMVWQNGNTRQVTVNYYGGASPVAQGWNYVNSEGASGWHVVGTGDFDRNGVPDLVWQNDTTRQVTVNYYGGSGGAVYQGWAYLNAAAIPGWSVVGVADIDGNGAPDLIWQNDTTKVVTVNYYGGAGGATYQGWAYMNNVGAPGWSVVGVADFDRNGTPDLVWQNLSTRQVTVNYYGGTGGAVYQGWAYLDGTGVAGWTVVGARDFNADGVPDLAWQNDTTHQVKVNYYGGQGGAVYQGWNWINSTGVTGWHVAAVADFDGNGEPDLVWLNETTRQATVNYYAFGGAVYQGWNNLNTGLAGWHVVGTGDFDGNGVPDLVWQNDSSRQVTVDYYGGAGGAVYQGRNYLNIAGAPGWSVVAVADMNGDGVPDLIWQNDTTKQVTANYYGGAGGSVYQGWNYLNSAGAPGWTVVGAADFDGNGTPDLVWQNSTTRQVTVNYYGGAGGASYQGWAYLNAAGVAGWTVAGASDIDGNGFPDLVWQNDATGQATVNYYGGAGGAVYQGWNWLSTAANPGWRVIVPQSR